MRRVEVCAGGVQPWIMCANLRHILEFAYYLPKSVAYVLMAVLAMVS